MNKVIFGIILLLFSLSIPIPGTEQGADAAPQPIKLADDVEIRELAPGIWLHTTYFDTEKYTHVPANGIIILSGGEAALIDLPWTDSQTAILFDWITDTHHAAVKTVVPTHFHKDCAGGLAEAHRRGADSIALDRTIELMKERNEPQAGRGFSGKTSFEVGDRTVELMFPGGGHTADNIVAWIPDSRVLFAGCALKGLNFRSIGNTADADLESYPQTLTEMKRTFPTAVMVVPGHGNPGGLELIDHTEKMLNAFLDQRNSAGSGR